jgi:hypothetical protein
MKHHGCHNRQPFKPWHHAQDGYHPMSKPEAGTRLPRIVQIPYRNTTDCQFTRLNPNDPGCAGCTHQKKA